MAEPTFARIGYLNAENEFVPKNIRAQDVFDTNGVSAETHLTDSLKHLTSEQITLIANAVQAAAVGAANGVAPLGSDSKIPAQYIETITLADVSQIVADIDALLALAATVAPLRTIVFVEDASDDDTVDEGWALYLRKGTAGETLDDWLKLSEGESLDIDFSDHLTTDDIGVTVASKKAADDAMAEAELLDAAYCTSETEMKTLNLRAGALVFMEVEND